MSRVFTSILTLSVFASFCGFNGFADEKSKIVFVAGKRSHGYGAHEHRAGCMLLAKALNDNMSNVEAVVTTDGWPQDGSVFQDAKTVVVYCDGGKRHVLNQHLDAFDGLAKDKVGLVCLHYAVETLKGKEGNRFLDWMGGYFEPNWSVNPHWTAEFKSFPKHPIANGIKPFSIKDEWYFHMRFQEGMTGVAPILSAHPPAATMSRKDGAHSGNPDVRKAVATGEIQHLGWAYDRPDGGRGFGFTGGHFHNNWANDDFRKTVLNAIVWTAHVDVPATGVPSKTPTQADLAANQDYEKPGAKKKKVVKPAKAEGKKKSSAKPLFATPKVVTPKESQQIRVNIADASTLYLVVTDGGNSKNSDHAAWGEPMISGPAGSKKLTDLKWKSAVSGWKSVVRNGSASGGALEIDGKKQSFGLGTHAPSLIVYELPKGYDTFTARVGIDSAQKKKGSVIFQVYDKAPPKSVLNETQSGSNAGAEDTADSSSTHIPADAFVIPDDLEISVWATSPMFYNPTNMDIDHAGRVWVAEGVNYRMFKNKLQHKHPEGDRIVVLEDSTGDGKADKHWTFVQDKDLKAPLGVAVIDNQIVVAQPPDMLIYTDVNRNLKFDEGIDTKEKFLSGFGGSDHDHSLHSVTVGPDGEWYFNTGNAGTHIVTDRAGFTFRAGSIYKGGSPSVTDAKSPLRGGQPGQISDDGHIYVGGATLRIRPDGTGLSCIGHNFRNAYEQTVDSFGDVFMNDNDDPPACRTTWLMEYGNLGFASADGTRSWRADQRPGQSVPVAEWRQEDPGTIPAGDVYGNGAPTGIVIHEGDQLGKKYRGLLVSCESARRVVYGYHPTPQDAGFALKRSDFMKPGAHGKSSWFRPADISVGADGALYVADWYDPGVGGHRMRDGGAYGAIYRITPKGGKLTTPKVDLNTTAGQIAALKSPAPNVRVLGFSKLKAKGDSAHDAVAALLTEENPYHQARAVWLLSQLGKRGLATVEAQLKSKDARIRVAAFRALRRQQHDLLTHAAVLAGDPSPAVRREVALAMRDLPLAQSRDILVKVAEGFDGKDRWYLEALGTGCAKKEAAMYEAFSERFGGPAKSWDSRFTWIAWRLHPPQSVPQHKARALDEIISKDDRNLALTAIAFNSSSAAADAMLEIAKEGPADLQAMAEWWIRNRSTNDWREYNPAAKLKQKAAVAVVAVGQGPAVKLPPIRRIAAMKGDVAKGRALFNTRAACFSCHTAEGKGGQIGPDLSVIGGKFGADVLLDSMINPSSAIAFGYEATTVVTKTGQTHAGFVVADGDPVVIKDMAGNQVAIKTADIKSRELMTQSIMPSVKNLGLSAQDLADITAYLKTLK
ncbi:MAG: putative membrane-bound dehydrogenase-like protein [Rhodothermales bacterium]|jgi:putative membrane-bound dehydrogenase-like protein